MSLELWIAWKLLIGNWKRAIFSFFAVIGGVVALILSFSLGNGGEKIISKDLLAISDNRIVLGGTNLNLQDIRILESYPMVQYAIFPEATIVDSGNRFMGYSNKALVALNLSPLKDNEVILDQKQFPDAQLGHQYKFFINGREYSFTVADLYDEINPFQLMKQGNRVILSQDLYNKLFNTYNYNSIIVSFDKNENVEEYVSYFISKFNKDRQSIDNVRLLETPEIYKRVIKIQTMVKNVLGLLSIISLCIGGFGIMNLIASGIKNRSSHIGIMRAMGLSKQKIIVIFLTEGVIISIIGSLIGIFCGIPFTLILGKIVKIPPYFNILHIIASMFIAIITGLIMGIIPAKKISTLNTVDALNNI